MTTRCGIAVAGTILYDEINEISVYPAAGELTKIHTVSRASGGCVPNVGADLAIMRPDLPVLAIGKVGDDDGGRFVCGAMEKAGMNVSGVRRDPAVATSFTQVMSVRGGERTFFTHPGASAAFGYDDVDFDALPVKMLHLGYFLLLDRIDAGDGAKILAACRERGIKTSVDFVTESPERFAAVRPVLPLVDTLIVNEIEACRLAGLETKQENIRPAAEALMKMGVRERVVIHLPAFGACLSRDGFTVSGSLLEPPGFKKGATGAGDAFCAGTLLGIYDGKSDREILEFAAMAATVSLSAPDATSGMKTEAEIRTICRDMAKKEVNL